MLAAGIPDWPECLFAAANGLPTDQVEHEHTTTYEYRARDPMAPYPATIAIESFEILERNGPDNLPIVDFVGSGAGHRTLSALERQAEYVAFFSEWSALDANPSVPRLPASCTPDGVAQDDADYQP